MNVIKKILFVILIGFVGIIILVYVDDVGFDWVMKMVQDGKILLFEKFNEVVLVKYLQVIVEDIELEDEYGWLIY